MMFVLYRLVIEKAMITMIFTFLDEKDQWMFLDNDPLLDGKTLPKTFS